MAGNDFGGVFRVKTSTGEVLSLRGQMSIKSSGRSAEAMTNQDGSVDSSETLTPVVVSVTFKDATGKYRDLIRGRRDWTFIEEDTGVTHYLTNAKVTGEPEENRHTGEISGLSVNCAYSDYTRT